MRINDLPWTTALGGQENFSASFFSNARIPGLSPSSGMSTDSNGSAFLHHQAFAYFFPLKPYNCQDTGLMGNKRPCTCAFQIKKRKDEIIRLA